MMMDWNGLIVIYPFSSSQRSDEGSREIEIIQGEGNSHCSTLAQQPMVSPSDGTQTNQVRTIRSNTVTEGTRESMLRFLLSDPAPSYLAFLNHFYGNDYRPEHISLLTGYLRQSMKHQYQSIWSSWLSFVRRSNPPMIT